MQWIFRIWHNIYYITCSRYWLCNNHSYSINVFGHFYINGIAHFLHIILFFKKIAVQINSTRYMSKFESTLPRNILYSSRKKVCAMCLLLSLFYWKNGQSSYRRYEIPENDTCSKLKLNLDMKYLSPGNNRYDHWLPNKMWLFGGLFIS